VQQPEKFWPEVISVCQQVFTAEPQRFGPWVEDAQFMAHLLAGLEFARANQSGPAQTFVDRAFEFRPERPKHPAVLAAGLYKTATYPWHTAFTADPLAGQALDNLSQCLTGSLEKRRVLGFLHLQRALKSLRQGRWAEFGQFLSRAGETVVGRDLLDWRSARMILAALVKAQ
jgi:hypothetical protein